MPSSAYWLNSDSRTFLSRGYLVPGQTAEERIRKIAETAERRLHIPGYANKLEQYILNGWISLASPVWSNFGERELPISCNGSYFEDSVDSIILKSAEIGMQTKHGAGTSAYVGALRKRGSPISTGGFADGPVHYMGLVEAQVDIISQSNIRRGNCAVYLDVEHPDIMEFLECREEGNPVQHLSLGVCIGDAWMEAMVAGDVYKRRIWARIIRKRFETGFPYIFWTDNVNRAAPKEYEKLGLKINASNLCSEIALSSGPDETFVCCLSSMNALKYEEWKDTDCVETVVFLLDAVLSEYLEKTADDPLMRTARNFAWRQRAIGIGTLGWHSFLQSKMIPFESLLAKSWNILIHKTISEQALAASKKAAEMYGEPSSLAGSGRRHMTLMAVAPTTSSAFILGQVSPSIEPYDSNYYVNDVQKGVFTFKNPYLVNLLESKGADTSDVWRDILTHGGSVQHLDFLSKEEKEVFKTFGEISQYEIVLQAAARQRFIDQSQSINFKIHPDSPPKDVSELMIEAWRLGIKTLYYQRSMSRAQEMVRSLLQCVSCEA